MLFNRRIDTLKITALSNNKPGILNNYIIIKYRLDMIWWYAYMYTPHKAYNMSRISVHPHWCRSRSHYACATYLLLWHVYKTYIILSYVFRACCLIWTSIKVHHAQIGRTFYGMTPSPSFFVTSIFWFFEVLLVMSITFMIPVLKSLNSNTINLVSAVVYYLAAL